MNSQKQLSQLYLHLAERRKRVQSDNGLRKSQMSTAKTVERMVIQKWTADWKVEAERGKDWRQKNDKGTIHELIVHDFPPQNSTLERGMCTRAKQAWTLLIASGLPRALWKEAMKHSAWIQNWTLMCILQGRLPYKECYKKKPNLVGIQEFGVAAYVKEMTVGWFLSSDGLICRLWLRIQRL